MTTGLRWLAAGLVLLVVLIAGGASLIGREIEEQFVRMETVSRLDDARDHFYGALGDRSANDISANDEEILRALADLGGPLSELANGVPESERLRAAFDGALIAELKINDLILTDDSAQGHLRDVSDKVDQLVLEAAGWKRLTDVDQVEASRQARALEGTLRRLNVQLDLLSKAVLANLRIRNELAAFRRYQQTETGQSNPLSQVTISTDGIPDPCDPRDEANADRLCRPSSARVVNEVERLVAQGADYTAAQVTRVTWALEAYERAAEIRFNQLQEEVDQALSTLGEARARVDAGTGTLGGLSRLSRTLRQSRDLVQSFRTDAVSDFSGARSLVLGLMSNIRIRANGTMTAIGLPQDVITAQRDQIQSIQDHWNEAFIDLEEREALLAELDTTLADLDAALSAISDHTRAESEALLTRITNLAIIATLALVLFAAGLIWLGQAYVAKPLSGTTLTILALARKELVRPVKLGRRWLGLGVLEDALERLRESETQFRTASELARVGRWRSTTKGDLYWSPETMELCGVAPEMFTGKNSFFYNMVHPDDRAALESARAEAFTTNKPFSVVHRLVKPGGDIATVYERADVMRDANGDVVGMAGVIQDITDTVELRHQLQQSQKLEVVGQLTGGVAHDFNNLLAVIVGSLELAADEDDPEELAELMDMALSASKRGADLTQNMLAFARQSRLAPIVLDLNVVVQETESWAMRILPANVEVDVQTSDASAKIVADPGLTQSSLLNLIVNARDAMPEGGMLSVETDVVELNKRDVSLLARDLVPGRYVTLSVTDTGTGIEPHALEKIFVPFFTTKPAGAGTGLGLPMIQGFMMQSGGGIHVTSAVGIGTTVTLYFKAHESVGTDQVDVKALQDASDKRRLRILLAEDDQDVRTILTDMLARANHSVTSVPTGDDALAELKSDARFDLLMTDVIMPGAIQGKELVDHARALFADLPIIVISGYTGLSGFDADASDERIMYLEKPVHKADLIDAIWRITRKD